MTVRAAQRQRLGVIKQEHRHLKRELPITRHMKLNQTGDSSLGSDCTGFAWQRQRTQGVLGYSASNSFPGTTQTATMD